EFLRAFDAGVVWAGHRTLLSDVPFLHRRSIGLTDVPLLVSIGMRCDHSIARGDRGKPHSTAPRKSATLYARANARPERPRSGMARANPKDPGGRPQGKKFK